MDTITFKEYCLTLDELYKFSYDFIADIKLFPSYGLLITDDVLSFFQYFTELFIDNVLIYYSEEEIEPLIVNYLVELDDLNTETQLYLIDTYRRGIVVEFIKKLCYLSGSDVLEKNKDLLNNI